MLPQLERHLDYVEAELGPRPWFAGEHFTAADIQMSYPLQGAKQRLGLQRWPRIDDFLHRIQARPAFQRAVQRGGEIGVP